MTHREYIAAFTLAILTGFSCAGGPAGNFPSHDPCEGIDAVQHLNERNVPPRFRDLLPLAARWGTGNRENREVMEQNLTSEEIDCLRDFLHERRSALMEWVRSTPPRGKRSREACAFKRMLQLYEDALDMQLRRTLR
ncbi:MAG: hypothetical protein JW838_07630 [Spirochaetes bacterium]|nr:hypothetical protein [Spirochaetota bacterium]